MNLLARLLSVPQPKYPADVAIARRIESQRGRKAAADKARADRLIALANASKLGRVSQPMRPRDEIAAEVRAQRDARKISPVPGGAEREVMQTATLFQPEGTWRLNSSPVTRDRGNHAGQSPSAGLFGGAA